MSLLHRAWRLLPRDARRAALFGGTALLAPRPERPMPDGGGSVTVAGFLGAPTGLGAAARRLARALREAGYDPHEADLTAALKQGAPRDPARPRPVVPPGPGTLLVHVNGPMMGWAMLALGRAAVAGKRVIGVWNWELPVLPADWRPGFRFAHEVWVSSRFTASAVREMAGGVPVHVVPCPVPAPDPSALGRADFGLPDDAFVSLCLFDASSSIARKNPLAAIRAHALAFGDRPDRLLLLKTHGTGFAGAPWAEVAAAAAARPNVRVLDAALDRRDLWALMAASDAVVSLHRAEGFGFAVAEAMRLGRPVVATGWSGNTDFMRGPGAHAVPYRLVPAEDPQDTYAIPGARWAEADVPAAAAILARIAEDPALRRPPPVDFPAFDYAPLLGR
ncbi:glycosyltransferase [Roseomonas sp. NAR14]|uniref:Glycosyltransferase n=1 Tax=Roseomonas acroporae TaxID=2937791 RepID=A0A9X2BVL7_9PROT|nr:glycosyltransferase [Roseomonas acroporae]MCK8786793.1 glycosyltransferase [Roseomonas acroporae]